MLAVLMSGCAADPSVEPTPTPTFANEDEAFAAAEATYRAYVDALNQVDLADPATSRRSMPGRLVRPTRALGGHSLSCTRLAQL